MSTMQTFYARLSTEPCQASAEPLAQLTQASLPQMRSLAIGWWEW